MLLGLCWDIKQDLETWRISCPVPLLQDIGSLWQAVQKYFVLPTNFFSCLPLTQFIFFSKKKEKKMDDAKYTFLILPIYTLWKLGPQYTMTIHPPPYTIELEKIGQSGKRRSRAVLVLFWQLCVRAGVNRNSPDTNRQQQVLRIHNHGSKKKQRHDLGI